MQPSASFRGHDAARKPKQMPTPGLSIRDVAKMEMANLSTHLLITTYQNIFKPIFTLAHKRSTKPSSSDNLAIPLF